MARILGGYMKRVYSDFVENLMRDIKIVDPITRHIITNDIGIIYQSTNETKIEQTNAENALIKLLENENFETRIIALQHLLLKRPTVKKNENVVTLFLNNGEYEEEVRALRERFSRGDLHSWIPIPNWQ